MPIFVLLAFAYPDARASWPRHDLMVARDDVGEPTVTDLDGDGDRDVVATRDGSIAWCESAGGLLLPPAELAVATDGPLRVVDLTGDGLPDLVEIDPATGDVLQHDNLGGATFAAPVAWAPLPWVADGLVFLDADGDGDLDALAYRTRPTPTTALLENTGGGALAAPLVLPGMAPSDAAVSDVDGDGDDDLLVPSGSGVSAWESTGLAFQVHPIAPGAAESPRWSDLDGDGDPDPSWRLDASDEIVWAEALGGWTFGAPVVLSDLAQGLYEVGDLDGDGDTDLVLESNNPSVGPDLAVRERLGNGTLGPMTWLPGSRIPIYGGSLLEDLDADGLPELIITGSPTFAYPNLGGRFDVDRTLFGLVDDQLTVAGDLVTVHYSDARAIAWTPTAGTYAQVDNVTEWDPPSIHDGITADLDSDGLDDLVLGFTYDDEIAYFPGQPGGSFGPRHVFANGVTASPFDTADIDGDGDLDILWSGLGGTQIGINDAGVSSATLLVDLFGSYDDVRFVDLDGDGDLDVLGHDWSDGDLYWIEQTGPGWSARRGLLTGLQTLAGFAWGDVDNDGQLDVVAAATGGQVVVSYYPYILVNENPHVLVLAGLGGSFAPPADLVSPEDGFADPHLTDVDGDGDLDLLVTTELERRWYGNDGTGVLTLVETVGEPGDASVLRDVDGDGDLDLVGVHTDGLSWWENPYGPPPPAPTGDTGLPSDTTDTGPAGTTDTGSTPEPTPPETGDTGSSTTSIPAPEPPASEEDEPRGCGCATPSGGASTGLLPWLFLLIACASMRDRARTPAQRGLGARHRSDSSVFGQAPRG